MSTLYTCLGVAISTLCAVVLAKLYTGTEWKIEAPLLFAVTLVILASHFGAAISVAGSLLAALVFAFLLYTPENSIRVASDTERSTLAWMILISISLSYLLYPTRSSKNHGNGRERDGHDNDSNGR
jgi:K+-sensing histidine kinase KdpD